MEIKTIDNIIEIKVRPEDDYTSALIPIEFAEPTLSILKNSDIYMEVVRCDSSDFIHCIVEEVKYDIEPYDESEVYAVMVLVERNELYDLIDFVNANRDKEILVRKYKNSELPEHQELLNEEAKKVLSEDEKNSLMSYLINILDMNDGNRCGAIIAYMEDKSFAELLLYCTESVREFILYRVTKRMEGVLRKEIENLLKEDTLQIVDYRMLI